MQGFQPRTLSKPRRWTGWMCSSCLNEYRSAARPFHRGAQPSFLVKTGRIQGTQRRWLSTTQRQLAEKRRPILPDRPARTRFAPSPTGYLHIGGLRTALFSYLLAKRTGGQFLLRIEDTDQKRLVPGAEERLLDDLQWAGLKWDEGPVIGGPYGPYKQSQRTQIYGKHVQELLARDQAYRCFCTAQTAAEKGRAAFVTSGCYQDCASLGHDESLKKAEHHNEPFTVRLRRTRDKRVYPDLVYGRITPLKRSAGIVSTAESDSGIDAADTILIKSDGSPTYHFANVVDDHLMNITHVIRGTEWMASTPLHYDLYHAFGWEPPTFAHVSLLVDEKQAKLSKRNADMALDVSGMRSENGILAEVLCNFIALQGWSNPRESDVLTMDELVDSFDLKFTRGNTMVRMEKLHYLQKQHVIRRCEAARTTGSAEPVASIVETLVQEARSQYPDVEVSLRGDQTLQDHCTSILLADSKSYQDARTFVARNSYFFHFEEHLVPPVKDVYDEKTALSGDFVKAEVTRMFESPQLVGLGWDNQAPGQGERLSLSADSIDLLSTKIHAVLELSAWRAAASMQESSPSEEEPDPTADPSDIEAYYIQLAREQQGGGEELATSLMDLKKAWTKSLMRYLRERLAYGRPGPRVGVIMTLLGHQECCRRLDIQPAAGR